jgi:hypothetical protein
MGDDGVNSVLAFLAGRRAFRAGDRRGPPPLWPPRARRAWCAGWDWAAGYDRPRWWR